MKKIFSILLTICLGANAFADKVSERVYVSTDKDVYLAGDLVWCSVFCTETGSGKLSSASAVAYLEISSTDGVLVTGKIALVGGRGSGAIQIPFTAPTGNYSLLGYTASEKGRDDLASDARLISIYNTFSAEKVKEGVEIVTGSVESSPSGAVDTGDILLEIPVYADHSSSFKVDITNGMATGMTLSIAAVNEDGLHVPAQSSVVSFMSAPTEGFIGEVSDLEGETFHGRLFGSDSDAVLRDYSLLAVVAFPGLAEDVYAGKIAPDGTVSFRTSNVYGTRDMVCEIIGQDDSRECRLVVESPFLNVAVPDIPTMKLSKSQEGALLLRHKSVRSSAKPQADTLFEYLPRRSSLFLQDKLCKVYHLDDYDRFPTIRETVLEITPDVRLRKGLGDKTQMQVLMEGAVKDDLVFSNNVLTMIDGVPVKDIDRLLDFDPMLLSDILVYSCSCSLGGVIFNGIVDFVTKKGDISSFKFDRNVVIVDWQGECYPVALTCQDMSAGKDDFRHTLYWHPQIELKAGERKQIEVRTPAYSGSFRIVAEGLSTDGKPVRKEVVLDVL